MAALLRSVRFLKFSPSGLLQVTGTKRTGPPLGRLYSGALGGGRTGTCLQLLSSTLENASSSRAWPYAVGCARRFAIATEKRDNISVTDRSKQVEQFDWALTKLDTSVRRTGRVTKSMLLGIFNIICESGYSSGNQALLLLRSCGSLLPEISLEERTVLAHCVWEKLQKLGVQFDVSHYNALLKVYLQNEFKFSPTDFLAKMEAANIQPNRVTYQRLIAAYCEDGNIEGASTILGFMKSENVPITEAVFNSMVTGHARAGDMESAKNILTVMRGAGIPPGPDTYVSLICAYAENGDIDNLKKTMEEAESEECFLMDRDIMQIIYSLAKAGHQQAIPEMVARMRHERGYVPDAMNLCLNLTTQKHEDTAFLVLKNFPILQTDRANASSDSISVGNFFLRHCVNIDVAVEKIIRYCTELQELDLHAAPHIFTLHCSLQAKKTVMSLELMQVIKEQGLPIRPHYFYPLLIPHVKSKNTAEVIELLKGMQQLGVSPDMETFSTYIYPTFPGIDEAREAIKEAGIKSKSFLLFEIRKLAVSNLDKFYAQISDPSFPSLDQHTFRSSLNIGFKMSDDVETMVKITELLHTDERFKTEDRSAGASVLLYSLINSMTQQEVQAQKEKLHRFFNQLKAKNITITQNFYKGISKLLVSYKVKDLITDLNGLIDTNEELSSGTKSPDVSDAETHTESMAPKRKLTSVGSKFSGSVLRRAILTACTNEDLQRALELKQKYEADMTPGCYAILVDQCCQLNNVEEALELKREMFCKDSSIALGTGKYISLVKALIKNNKVEEALDILKEMKEKEVVLNDTHITSLFHMLNSLVGKEGGGVTIRQLQETIFGLGLTKPTVNLCFPLISHYLDSNDLSGALDAVFECHKRYDFMPHMHDVLVSLVEKGDTELLQKAMDFVSQERGEMNMLYDLFFSFLQTGRYREARKIAETPGLRARPGRLQWYAERCIFTKQMEPLEQMVDMTAKLFECDRDEMYNYILRLCKEMNDWQRANAVWTKMQEENVIPRERTLHLLADILKSNGQQVPFELLEKWYEQTTPVEQKASTETNKYYKSRILDLCKEGNRQEALKLLKDAEKEGVSLSNKLYDHMIRMLLAQGEIEDAMMVRNMAMSHFPGFQLSNISSSLLIISNIKKGNIRDAMEQMKSMLQEKQTPLNVSVTRLVQALSNQGDLAGIQEVESLVKSLDKPLKVSSMLFISHEVMVHIRNGDLDTAVEQLESLYTSPDTVNPSISYVFRKILEEGNDKALDKLSVMAERLANHFACYRPAVDLFIQLVDMDKVEDAKFMLARCNAVAEQKEMLMSYVNKKTQTPGQVDKIKTLVNLIPDCLDKDLFDYYLMKCHIMDKDLASAKALYEQMQKDMVVKDELLLKRLAALYRESGETVPFEEPPKSFKFYIEKARNKNFKSLATAEE